MRQPNSIVFTFASFKSERLDQEQSAFSNSEERIPTWLLKLSVPFAHLESVKKAINACCAVGYYTIDFAGDVLIRRLRSLSQAGCLSSKEVDRLGERLEGAVVRFSGAGSVDFEVLATASPLHQMTAISGAWKGRAVA